MKRLWFLVAAIFAGGWSNAALLAQEELPREPIPAVANTAPRLAEEAEPLTRGPVHEAFAQAVTPAAEVGLVVGKEPPPLIDEIPPAQRPAGDDIAWVPGYWGWDDDLKDFIWISGIWRAMPPGREWVPGYWVKVTDGYQWISGYWADVRNEEVTYLPAPPETVDAGPNTNPPTGDEIWIPGTWMWQQNKYVWRAGYWAVGNPRWLWTNAHYVYTPRGYLYVNGYWDFLVPQRGVLFTPVYFRAGIPSNYVYSPRLIVNTAVLVDHLFLRPTYRHYYFGDYYAANYRGRGILPYFVFQNSRYGYDSIYSYNRWQHRHDQDWDHQVHARYEKMRDSENDRPPRDYTAWREYRERDGNRNDGNPFLSNSLQDYGKLKGHDWKFRDIDEKTRQTVGSHQRDLDKYRQGRIKLEAEKSVRTGDENRGGDTVRLLKPPVGEHSPGRDFGPGREDRPGRDDRPIRTERDADAPRIERPTTPRVDPPGPPGGRASDGTVPPRATPMNPRDLPGPLNDIRDRDDRKDPAERPKANRDRPGPLNDIRDQPRDAPKGPTRTDPDGDGKPGVTPLPGKTDRPKVDVPKNVPKATPAPRDVPKATPAPRDVPKATPAPPRDVPKATPAPRETPKANPQPPPPRNERPQGGNKGGGNQGEGNPGKGKRN